jgi:hypothetical protein
MARFLGGAFGVAILAAVFAATGSLGTSQAFSAGFAATIGVSAALSLGAAIVGLGLPARRQATMVDSAAKTGAEAASTPSRA